MDYRVEVLTWRSQLTDDRTTPPGHRRLEEVHRNPIYLLYTPLGGFRHTKKEPRPFCLVHNRASLQSNQVNQEPLRCKYKFGYGLSIGLRNSTQDI